MSFYAWKPYVSVAARRAKAAKQAAKFVKSGRKLEPVAIEGRTIARTFWGKAWCDHLESFSDYANRLPRGRTYARNGSVIDLQISAGSISALVMGSELYTLQFSIKPLEKKRWSAIKERCNGQIDSLVELLQGRFSDAVMGVITDRDTGLFPTPKQIEKSCSCPDWAGLCKHLAAALYGVGARLDQKPEMLFLLRGVDYLELLESVSSSSATAGPGSLDAENLADVFGIEITPDTPVKPRTKKAASQPLSRKPARTATKSKSKAKAKTKAKPARNKAPAKVGLADGKAKANVRTRRIRHSAN